MVNKGVTGIRRIINAAGYSYAGLVATLKNEAAFRQELALVAILVPVAFWFGEGSVEKALLVSSLLLILIVELINSAIESVIDRIGSEQHELSGRAKDIGSAAVFLALLNAAVIWAFLLLI
ncbi:MAG TPA: diacylglycerol kinase [Gammaproteobacteria bacterium]|nr:diacylglycerol kinase [bacterium BMS3Abin11]GMT39323.1 MAG: diacylglycerol kinase [bacterium]HDH15992.1 diacylglycerol kinase [Gammaproteobacteria bacterium]HDZ79294.1 diacylglycerol kinase [Gammaproteobacteria bacterium]